MKDDSPRPAPDAADRELQSLFAAMKEDAVPPGIESRLLQALAAAPPAPAPPPPGSGAWGGLASALKAPLAKLVIVGVVSGSAVWTGQSLLRPTAPTPTLAVTATGTTVTPAAPRLFSPTASPADHADAPADHAAPTPPATEPGLAAPAAPGAAVTPAEAHAPPDTAHEAAGSRAERSGTLEGASRNRKGALSPESPAQEPAPAALPAVVASAADPAPAVPSVVVAPAPVASITPADLLLREIGQVHAIAALVEAGRCGEARGAIARYRVEQPAGQLAAEVTVLEGRCRGR
jgi:hypothetical protein